MNLFLLIFAAILPAALVLQFIYWKDRKNPEPSNWLWRAFAYGIGSALVALAIGAIGLMPHFPHNGILLSFADAFSSAAIPEECAKLLMLWLLLRKNPYFDEYFDGIVYAACIGMGFAAFENILYLISNIDCWQSVAVSRALFAVPGHFCFAVLMGYFYSLYHFGYSRHPLTCAMILIAPILAHGIYDGLLMSQEGMGSLFSTLFTIIFLAFFWWLARLANSSIRRMAGK